MGFEDYENDYDVECPLDAQYTYTEYDDDDCYDDSWADYDACFECQSYGDDYCFDEYGDVKWRCLECPLYCQDVGY